MRRILSRSIRLARATAPPDITMLRAAKGVGLKEAKEHIDAMLRTGLAEPAGPAAPRAGFSGMLPPVVLDALRKGNKLDAIRLLREHSGLSLKDAKDAVERHMGSMGDMAGLAQESPGQVRESHTWLWLIAAALVAFAFYRYFFR